MPQHKVRFTIWLDPATLQAARARAAQEHISVSEALAHAAAESLGGDGHRDAEAQILKAIERVFFLVQRIDRRRSFDQQVLKEMLGLAVLSFFNHTPAVPEANKKAALLDGKARFHRFLDTLAANLRGGRSILSDLPAPQENRPVEEEAAEETGAAAGADAAPDPRLCGDTRTLMTADPGEPTPRDASPRPAQSPSMDTPRAGPEAKLRQSGEQEADSVEGKKRWSLFG